MGHPLLAAPSRGDAVTWSQASAAAGFMLPAFLGSDKCRKRWRKNFEFVPRK